MGKEKLDFSLLIKRLLNDFKSKIQYMGKSQQSFNKKEREKKRQKKRKEKAERKLQRKEEAAEKKSTDTLMYVDENGNLTETPPDPNKRKEIKAEDIDISSPSHSAREEEDPIRKGQVKFFNEEKGYGFIIDRRTKNSIFVHAAGLEQEVKGNDKVQFEIVMGPKGPNAVRVNLLT